LGSSDRLFALAAAGRERGSASAVTKRIADAPIRRQRAAARLLVQNNEAEEAATGQIQRIHDRVERTSIGSRGVFVTILCTSLALIYSNRRLFQQLETLSQERRVLASRLISMQEEVLRSVAHELHDDLVRF